MFSQLSPTGVCQDQKPVIWRCIDDLCECLSDRNVSHTSTFARPHSQTTPERCVFDRCLGELDEVTWSQSCFTGNTQNALDPFWCYCVNGLPIGWRPNDFGAINLI
ncbi:hypothetical protein CLV76_11866 [Marivita geojedonensis]|nr:hypothetical protein CLV76_11866 [Marivita geojedonensis]